MEHLDLNFPNEVRLYGFKRSQGQPFYKRWKESTGKGRLALKKEICRKVNPIYAKIQQGMVYCEQKQIVVSFPAKKFRLYQVTAVDKPDVVRTHPSVNFRPSEGGGTIFDSRRISNARTATRAIEAQMHRGEDNEKVEEIPMRARGRKRQAKLVVRRKSPQASTSRSCIAQLDMERKERRQVEKVPVVNRRVSVVMKKIPDVRKGTLVVRRSPSVEEVDLTSDSEVTPKKLKGCKRLKLLSSSESEKQESESDSDDFSKTQAARELPRSRVSKIRLAGLKMKKNTPTKAISSSESEDTPDSMHATKNSSDFRGTATRFVEVEQNAQIITEEDMDPIIGDGNAGQKNETRSPVGRKDEVNWEETIPDSDFLNINEAELLHNEQVRKRNRDAVYNSNTFTAPESLIKDNVLLPLDDTTVARVLTLPSSGFCGPLIFKAFRAYNWRNYDASVEEVFFPSNEPELPNLSKIKRQIDGFHSKQTYRTVGNLRIDMVKPREYVHGHGPEMLRHRSLVLYSGSGPFGGQAVAIPYYLLQPVIQAMVDANHQFAKDIITEHKDRDIFKTEPQLISAVKANELAAMHLTLSKEVNDRLELQTEIKERSVTIKKIAVEQQLVYDRYTSDIKEIDFNTGISNVILVDGKNYCRREDI